MKRLTYLYFAFFALTIVSCVDDYFEANPPQPLDAPYAFVSSSIPEGADGIPLTGGETVTLSINIVDAPGVLNEIAFAFSKGGEVVSHTFDAIAGQTSGTFEVTVKAPVNIDGTTTFTAAISDAQEEPKVLTISRVLDVSYLHEGPDFTVEIIDADGVAYEGDVLDVVITVNDIPSGAIGAIAIAGTATGVTFDQAELDALIGKSSGTVTGQLAVEEVTATATYDISVAITDELQNRQAVQTDEILYRCSAAFDISGTYDGIANGIVGANDSAYYQLPSTVTITQVNAGQYEVSDISFGLYPEFAKKDATIVAPTGILNVCGIEIEGDAENEDAEEESFAISGTVQVADEEAEAIILEWENSKGDTGTVTLLKQ